VALGACLVHAVGSGALADAPVAEHAHHGLESNHALGFAALAFLSHWSWPGRTVLPLTGLLAYGGLIEVLQSLTPGRYAELADLFADGVGLAIGAVLARLLAHWMLKRQNR
jgi:VanZ family protein